MKAAQRFALILGIAYVLIGFMGFVPALLTHPETMSPSIENYGLAADGYLMGLFPVNPVHNIIHITTGVFGIVASIALDSSRFFSGQVGIYYTLLTILGIIPFTRTFFGIIPIYGADVLLHGATGLLGIYFGFLAKPSLLKLFRRELKEDAVSAEIL